MFNAVVKEKKFQKLREEGYEVKHNKNVVIIRNDEKILVELIWLEDNQKIIMTEDNVYWCIKIENIEILSKGIKICFYDAKKKYQEVEIE